MATRTAAISNTQLDIWNRILDSEHGDLTPEAAAFILRMDFTKSDREHVQELNDKAK